MRNQPAILGHVAQAGRIVAVNVAIRHALNGFILRLNPTEFVVSVSHGEDRRGADGGSVGRRLTEAVVSPGVGDHTQGRAGEGTVLWVASQDQGACAG